MPQSNHLGTNTLPGLAHRISCGTCWVRGLCLGDHLPETLIDQADTEVSRRGPLGEGEYLFQAGDPCTGIHIVQTGLVKKVTVTADGSERVLGFHMGGDIVGFEGLDEGRHHLAVQALDTTTFCHLTVASLERIACTVPPLYRRVIHLLANGDFQDLRDNVLLRDSPAEVRVVAFLLRFAERLAARHQESRNFMLKVPRRDLANYLGLKRETVSRTLSRLQRDGLIELGPQRQFRLLDPAALRERLAAHQQYLVD